MMKAMPQILFATGALFFILPIIAGLIGTWLPAFGFLPSIGRYEMSLVPFIQLFNHPSTLTSIKLSISSALIATVVAFGISQWLCMRLYKKSTWRWLTSSLAPLLAIPHLAFAIGFSFLIAPSGWIMRCLSPMLTGFNLPPDWLIVNDNYALSLTLALVIKEIPFFLLMSLSAMSHLNVAKTLHIAASYKYSHTQAWIKLVFPQMFKQLRLPLYAVLSYALSVIDVSLVLGPTTPATFAVLINQWFNNPDTDYRIMGASAACCLLLLVITLIYIFYLIELWIKKSTKNWLIAGPTHRPHNTLRLRSAAMFVWSLLVVSTFATLVALLVWSLTQQWRFPSALPSQWTLKYWLKSSSLIAQTLYNTAIIGVSSAAIGLIISIFILQWQSEEARRYLPTGQVFRPKFWILTILYLPILIPQVSFLFGVQVLLISLSLEGLMFSLIWSHLLFVLPYCYLSLAKSYLQFDERYLHIGATLCQSKWRALVYIKWPMLLRPLSFSFAIGFAVSASQYLPSLYVGAGRVNTLTLETVALASGSDLRVTSVFALWQFLLPLLIYLAALGIPQYLYRHRRSI